MRERSVSVDSRRRRRSSSTLSAWVWNARHGGPRRSDGRRKAMLREVSRVCSGRASNARSPPAFAAPTRTDARDPEPGPTSTSGIRAGPLPPSLSIACIDSPRGRWSARAGPARGRSRPRVGNRAVSEAECNSRRPAAATRDGSCQLALYSIMEEEVKRFLRARAQAGLGTLLARRLGRAPAPARFPTAGAPALLERARAWAASTWLRRHPIGSRRVAFRKGRKWSSSTPHRSGDQREDRLLRARAQRQDDEPRTDLRADAVPLQGQDGLDEDENRPNALLRFLAPRARRHQRVQRRGCCSTPSRDRCTTTRRASSFSKARTPSCSSRTPPLPRWRRTSRVFGTSRRTSTSSGSRSTRCRG